ncbi:transaltion initiation factor [Schizosaccharomyces cryophilus OY26]|uniref:Transaltion initiation factor n=1 Tax=Schizosaccharomyces cryophilus (strain OY26 / ATCC MYA-4695 / CBS 11777 / NBRC 106824 / NRRL Y48691) TaxID=653667 RepID=S9W2Z7_SCHCR|nr:transaltion initiation factor [Schizosaccharomyces cryophilus OY26]EPY52939.1 transaltion initiation factor [Schizosaccharomyces cryophilus OY26]
MGPKRNTKMSLTAFLGDEQFGSTSWADDVDDLPSLPQERLGFRNSPSVAEAPSSTYEPAGRPMAGEGRRDMGFQREAVPIPTEPPFTAYVGNLSFDLTEADIADFFGEGVTSVRLVTDPMTERSRGFGYVEFETADLLSSAMALSGENLMGRAIRITVAEPRRAAAPRDDRTSGDWVRRGPLPPPERRDSGSRDGFMKRRAVRDPALESPRESPREERDWVRRGPMPSRDPSTRPRLNLKPRSAANEQSEVSSTTSNPPTKPKSDPFGGAKPVDNTPVLKRVEEKLAKRTQTVRRDSATSTNDAPSEKKEGDSVETVAEQLSEVKVTDQKEPPVNTEAEAPNTVEAAPVAEGEDEGWTKIGKGRKF